MILVCHVAISFLLLVTHFRLGAVVGCILCEAPPACRIGYCISDILPLLKARVEISNYEGHISNSRKTGTMAQSFSPYDDYLVLSTSATNGRFENAIDQQYNSVRSFTSHQHECELNSN